jgi:hypothetical protein
MDSKGIMALPHHFHELVNHQSQCHHLFKRC